MMIKKYAITGMSCSACSANVEKKVGSLAGVKKAEVYLMKNQLVVDYDEEKLKDSDIIRAVTKIGYGASVWEDAQKNPDKQKSSNREQDKTENNIEKEENKLDQAAIEMRKRLIYSIAWLIPLMYLSMGYMLHFPLPYFLSGIKYGVNYALMQAIFTLPVLYLNRKFFQVGFRALWYRVPNMDSLVAVGSGAAFLYGLFATFRMSTGLAEGNLDLVAHYHMDLYFESAAMILTLVTVGKYLETKSKGKTSRAVEKLMNLVPKQSLVLRDGEERWIASDQLLVNDVIIVKQGGAIGADGTIIEGFGTVDESSLTGESLPVEKTSGELLTSGTVVLSGFMKFKADKVGNDTMLSQIIKLVDEAGASKAPIAKLADRVAGIFVPAVMVLSALTGIVWILAGHDFEFALARAITVLVISCPCALGLATPTAIMVGTGKGAEKGILIKTAESLERLKDVDTLVFDKTGTLTQGKPEVVNSHWSKIGKEQEALMIIGALESKSEHPLSQAIIAYVDATVEKQEVAEDEIAKTYKNMIVEDYLAVPGGGLEGLVNHQEVACGNRRFMDDKKINIEECQVASSWELEGKTVLYFGVDGVYRGAFAIADKVKTNAKKMISQLQKLGIHTVMLTGDQKTTAETVQKNLGVERLFAQVLPQEKEEIIAKLQAEGHIVAMVGDGVNDAPALVRADVGLAIGGGTDIAIESADMILVHPDIMVVVQAVKLSRAVIRNIKQNLFWAFFYNILGIPIAAGVLIPAFAIQLNPMMGAAAMSLSSVFVVTNALRLRNFGKKDKNEKNEQNKQSEQIKQKEEKKQLNQVERNKEENKMKKEIMITGMMCQHCQKTVKEALEKIQGIENIEVNLEENKAIVEVNSEVTDEMLVRVVENAGYEVTAVK